MNIINHKSKSVRIFIPSNWEKIQNIEVENKKISSRRNDFHLLKYFMHCCYSATYLREDGAPFSYQKAAAICKGDRKPFSRIKKALLNEGVITCDDVAILRKKSFHYQLGPMMKDVKWNISLHSEQFTIPKSDVEQSHQNCQLTIDDSILDKSLDYAATVRRWTNDRKEYWRWHLTDNWDNDAHGCKTGRVYGTWSRVPRELRGMFMINGESTVEVDIKSAQPNLLINLYDDRCSKECQNFIKVIQKGKFYEIFMRKTGIEDRNKVKENIMAFLCGKVKSNSEISDSFQDTFPILFEKIRKKIEAHHCSLSWWLQGQESEIIVRKICKDFPVYSMHDGVICQASLAEKVQKATENAIREVCGITGIVVIENKREAIEKYANEGRTA